MVNMITFTTTYFGGLDQYVETQFDEIIWDFYEEQGSRLTIYFDDLRIAIKRSRVNETYTIIMSCDKGLEMIHDIDAEDLYDFMLNNIIVNEWDF